MRSKETIQSCIMRSRTANAVAMYQSYWVARSGTRALRVVEIVENGLLQVGDADCPFVDVVFDGWHCCKLLRGLGLSSTSLL